MLIAKPEIDLSAVQRDWKAWVETAGQQFDAAIGKGSGPGTVGGGIATISAGLTTLTESAKKTAAATKSIADSLHLDKIVGGIGPAKALVDALGESMLGLSESTTKAVSSTLDLAEKGAQLGSAAGPWGAALGAIGGGILGAYNAKMTEAAKNTKELKEAGDRLVSSQKEVAKALAATNAELAKAQSQGLEASLAAFDAITPKIAAAQEKIDQLREDRTKLLSTAAGFSEIEARAKAVDAFQVQIEEQQALIKALTTGQENAAAITKQLSFESAKQATEVEDKSTKALLAKQAEAKGTLDAARGEAALLAKRATLLGADTEGIRENARATIENNKRLAEAQKAFDATSAAIESSGKKTASAAKTATAAVKEFDALWENYRSDSADLASRTTAFLGLLEKEAAATAKATTDAANAALENFKRLAEESNRTASAFDADRARAAAAVASIVTEMGSLKSEATDAAIAIGEAFGGQAVRGINAFFDAYANGTKRTREDRKRARADFERDLGTQLMNQGAADIVQGVAKLFTVKKAEGTGQIIAGGAEVALGATLGGVGARGQRATGGTGSARDSGTPSTGNASVVGGTSGNTGTTYIINEGSNNVYTGGSERERQRGKAEILRVLR